LVNPFQTSPVRSHADVVAIEFPRASAQHAIRQILQQVTWVDQDATGDYNPDYENDDDDEPDLKRKRSKRSSRARKKKRKSKKKSKGKEPESSLLSAEANSSEVPDIETTEQGPANTTTTSADDDENDNSSDQLSMTSIGADVDDEPAIDPCEPIDRSHDNDPEYWGRWGRPIRFCFDPAYQEPTSQGRRKARICYFHEHPMFGHPAPDPAARRGRSSGIEGDRGADYMCFQCTMLRVAIGFCPHGAFCRVNQGLDLKKAYRKLGKGIVARSSPLCSVCSGFAAYSCRDKFHLDQGSRPVLGCGLALCGNCFAMFVKKYKSNLEKMLRCGNFSGAEYPTDVRADVDFLRVEGGALVKQAIEKGVF
jgi:hypothetical protein